MSFYVNNVIFNKTVTKIVTTLTKCFFPYLNPTSYLITNVSDFAKDLNRGQTYNRSQNIWNAFMF